MAEFELDEPVADPIGARLKSARETQGMSLDDVAAKTRVPIRHLLHMEKGEWDELPAPTYSVGFARAYANVVGLNAAEIGAELRAQLVGTQTTPTPSYYEPADPARVPPRSLALIAALVALVLIAGYFVWRSSAVDGEDPTPVAQSDPVPDAPAPAPAPAPATPAPGAAAEPVVLTATNDVWLRVYEAGGRRLFENILKAGESFVVPPTANRPQILTGRPDQLRVMVGSTPIPALGPPEKTIADVSLLPADLLARRAAPTPAPSPAARPRARAPAPVRTPAPASEPAAAPATTP